jgi:addiction module HigA family antidote
MSLSQQQLAKEIKVPYQRVNELVNGRRGITPGTALRLSRLFGNSADYWLNLQLRWDLYFAREKESKILKEIHPLHA